MTNQFKIGDLSAADVFSQITAAGITATQANLLIGNWILETAGRNKRVFNYNTDFPAEDTDCTFDFQRIFQHQDWQDGVHPVQAEETAGEEGFNSRFHKIEQDIDNLATEVAKAMLCMAEMRRDLRSMMDEIHSAINLLNGDVFDLKGDSGSTGPGPFQVLPGRLDLNPQFVGATKFFDKNVNVWQTGDGYMMLPSVVSGGLDPGSNPRVKRPGALARFIEEEPAFRTFFETEAITRDRIIENFGDRVLTDGGTVREAVAILPDNARFGSVETLIEGIAEREAAAIRTANEDVAVISAALGVGHDVESVEEAPVTRLGMIPNEARIALRNAGVDTVGSLSAAQPTELAERLRAGGVTTSIGEVASWTATARTLARIRPR